MNIKTMKEELIEEIVNLFNKANVWNNGIFLDSVKEYCLEKSLNYEQISNKLEEAFYDFLATNITSQNAIRFRLKQLTI